MSGSFDIKMIVKHTFLEFVQFPSHGRRRSATVGAIAEIEDVEEYTSHCENSIQQPWNSHSWSSAESGDESEEALDSSLRPFDCSSWSTVASSDSNDIVPDMQPEHLLVQENARLARENAELRALKDNIMHGASNVIQSGESKLAALAPEVHADQQGVVGDTIVSVVMVSAPFLPMVDFSAGRPQIMFQPSHQIFDQFPHDGTILTTQIGDDVSSNHNINAFATENYTTVMLRNLPNMYTREMTMNLLDSEGFAGKFTFVYLPIDFKSSAGLGYVFVDMESQLEAERARQHFDGFSHWIFPSGKICSVSWSLPDQQGLSAQIERYRNSPVMHKSVPDEWKPILLSGGERIPFPPPTRKIRAPRVRP